LLLGKRGAFDADEEKNLYSFVRNGSVNGVDPQGLYFGPFPIIRPFPDETPDPKKTHVECLNCQRCSAGAVLVQYYGCFVRRPNDTPMNKKAFEDCMAPLVKEVMSACLAFDIQRLDTIAKRSKLCYDHHW